MIQRCTECGKWCETVGNNFLERAFLGALSHVEDCGEIGERYIGKLGKRIGQAVGAYSSASRGIIEAVNGYKYQFQCECGHSWGTDNEEDDETAYYEHECNVDELCGKFSEVDVENNDERLEYFNELQEAWDNEYNTAITQSMICDATAALFVFASMDLEDKEEYLEQALTEVNTSLKLFDDENTHITKGLIFAASNNYSYYDSLRELIYCKGKESHPYFSIKSVCRTYNEMCEGYEECFLEIPKEQRKYLVLVDDYVAFPDSFKVLRTAKIPDNLKFLGDNIIKNTLYVIHPLKEDTYIPVNDYAIDLFREQLYEYREIMECLGAKSFTIKDVHSSNSENSKNTAYKVGGGGEYKGYSAKGSYDSKEKTENYKQLYNELSQEVKCELSKRPYIPENTLWYQHKSDWQRNCDSRLAERMLVFKQNVTNRISTGITKQDSKMIEGEFNAMIVKLNGNYESDTRFSIKEDAEHTWEISVEFYPMSEYNKPVNQDYNLQLTLISNSEQEYISDVKLCLENDGEITAKERCLLERTRERLGISSERAYELENMFVVQKPSKRKWWKKFF